MPLFEASPDPPPSIQAINHVRLEARPGVQAQLRSFYIDALGLEPVEGEPGMVCFQTQRMQVRILITLDAQPSPMRRRLVLQIPSLERMRERLEEFEIDYQWYEGLSFTDQRIFVHDPADNRVELKQLWPM